MRLEKEHGRARKIQQMRLSSGVHPISRLKTSSAHQLLSFRLFLQQRPRVEPEATKKMTSDGLTIVMLLKQKSFMILLMDHSTAADDDLVSISLLETPNPTTEERVSTLPGVLLMLSAF